jgi:hypothetical protein
MIRCIGDDLVKSFGRDMPLLRALPECCQKIASCLLIQWPEGELIAQTYQFHIQEAGEIGYSETLYIGCRPF